MKKTLTILTGALLLSSCGPKITYLNDEEAATLLSSSSTHHKYINYLLKR